MLNFIKKHLRDFNPSEPMFWRMKLSYADYCQLEAAIADASDAEIMSHPVAALCYLAEWYKWRYAPAKAQLVRHFNPTSEQIKQLLADAGIDADRWVAVNPDTGRHSWLYSVYVLGGLPVAHELGRRADNRFLQSLCRMYHGKSVDDEIDDSGRAEAFRLSLKDGGSLNLFIREIIHGNVPFAAEDIKDSTSAASRLIRRIIEANNEVLHDKFSLEWRISAPEESDNFGRRLFLNLLPEITGEGLHQYLMYDRVRMWGFENPAELQWIDIGIDFVHGEKVIASLPAQITYTNNYHPDRGFLSVGIDQRKVIRDIPAGNFDTVVVTARGENGEYHEAQRFTVDRCMQFYATDQPDEWTDSTRSQRATAVLWAAPWRNAEPLIEGLTMTRPFRSRSGAISATNYHLTLVPESFTLINREGEEVTFYDHQGTDTLTSHRHDDTVRYLQGDKVRCIVEVDDEEEELMLPLLMTRQDVVIRRLSSDEFDNTVEELIDPEMVEWKSGARYTEWTEDNTPPVGLIKVRCMVRGRMLVKEFAYIGGTITRDLNNKKIIVPPGGYVQEPLSEICSDSPLAPTLETHIENIIVDVWQPVRFKEINRGDTCYYRTEDETFSVPVLTADQLWVAVFSERGYQSYSCMPLISLYALKGQNHHKVAMLLNTLPDHSKNDWTEKATDLDPTAPPELNVVMCYPNDEAKGKWLMWKLISGEEPIEVEYGTEPGKATVIFQDRRVETSPLAIYTPKRTLPSPWDKVSATPVECFKLGAKYHTYYFLFTPLEKLETMSEFMEKVYNPVLEEYNGILPADVQNELTRAGFELGFITTNDQS